MGMNIAYLRAMHDALSLATLGWRESILAALASQDYGRVTDAAVAAEERGDRALATALRAVAVYL